MVPTLHVSVVLKPIRLLSMSDYFDRVAQSYRDAHARMLTLAEPLSEDAFNWKPDAETWSVGEVVVHLNKASKGYLPKLTSVLQDAEARGEPPFRYGLLSRLFIKAVSPEPSFKMKAPRAMAPVRSGDRSEVQKKHALSRFDADMERFVEMVESARGIDLATVKTPSPFLPWPRFPAGALLEANGLHALRHTNQAERLAARPGFPG